MAKTIRRKSYKKKMGTRKNSNFLSVSKMKRGHKKHIKHHYLKGKHKTSKQYHGGYMYKKTKKMKGGMVSSPASGPVGYSWDGGNIATWPGAGASQGLNTNGATMSNHFKVSPNGIVVGGITTPESSRVSSSTTQTMNGGKKGKKDKKQKGGFFQELINLGRGVQYNVQGIGYDIIGKNQPISQNPYPTQDQPIDNGNKIVTTTPTNIKQVFVDANNSVAKI